MRRVVGGIMLGLATLMGISALLSLLTSGDFGAFIIGMVFPAILGVGGWWIGNFGDAQRATNFGGTTEDQARLQRDQSVASARAQREAMLDQQRAELASMRDEMRRAAEARNRELGM
ncbi:hypothetical protein [Mycobacteroides abscessus]|uniref:hypothetical protein n=1 Tax=Mycobacteroides abscessus TaxID=36809 RepID=UPI00094485BA|nr:hypothetical protein [Mycobacteroides abscessus]